MQETLIIAGKPYGDIHHSANFPNLPGCAATSDSEKTFLKLMEKV